MSNNKNFHTVRGYEILGKQKKLLSNSMEDYLEMIYRNSLQEGYTRINNLAESLNVQAPSATRMVQKLAEVGFLHYEKYGIIQLTKKGEKMGKFLLKRHMIIESFLKVIGVEKDLLINIELIEHNISINALEKIRLLIAFFESNPDVIKKFDEYKKMIDPNKE